jgi:hypothetical protein
VIERFDDLPVHQSPAPLAVPATDDPRAYERYWFGLGALDGSAMVGLVVNVHPVLGLVDAAFSVSDGDRTVSLFAKDALRHGRDDLRAGPVRLTLDDPMRSLRIRVDGDDPDAHGFSADLRVDATTPAIAEDRVTRTRGDRVVQDRTRYVQLGTVTGRVTTPLGDLALTPDTWRSGRDHSWGIWDAPDPDAPPRAPSAGPSFFWLIGAFDDVAIQAVTHAEPDGRRYGEYGATTPTLAAGADPTGPGVGQEPLVVTGFDVAYAAGTGRAAEASVVLGTAGGASRPIAVTSLHATLPRAVGYAHPDWVPGRAPASMPEVRTGSWTTADLDLAAPENRRALQFVRMTRPDGSVGHGFVDQSGGPG